MMFDGEAATVELAFTARRGMLAQLPASRCLFRVCIDNGALTRFISETDFPIAGPSRPGRPIAARRRWRRATDDGDD